MTHSIDTIMQLLDEGLRHSFIKPECDRPSPADTMTVLGEGASLNASEQQYSAELMRVNHVGEVCAQALYQGQALTARSSEVREKMQHAADEEIDHLNWTFKRIEQLDSHVSYLNPIWYLSSLAIGITAGIVGDKWSLGFLAETEKQVVKHLESHLCKLPENDIISRSIVEKMAEDEAKHAEMAEQNGAEQLPDGIKQFMTLTAKIMTTVAAKI